MGEREKEEEEREHGWLIYDFSSFPTFGSSFLSFPGSRGGTDERKGGGERTVGYKGRRMRGWGEKEESKEEGKGGKRGRILLLPLLVLIVMLNVLGGRKEKQKEERRGRSLLPFSLNCFSPSSSSSSPMDCRRLRRVH